MALRTTNSAESWEKIYQAFNDISFVSYDFDSIRQSLIDYTRTYYPEQYNDYITSAEFIMLLEAFAYVAEQLAYRVDMVSHENFITTAQRKESILRLAKLVSYKPTRNIPLRGLVKFTTVTTTERVIDSRGIDLSGLTITWNDPNNPNWREQFILVMNRLLSSRLGQPQKSFQVGDVVMDLYSLRNEPEALRNGVVAFSASTGQDSYPMELVPTDLDANGPFEREPDLNAAFSIVYANDGIGDGSDYTGFLAHVKQGVLTRIDYSLEQPLPNRRLEFLPQNINQTDVWVQEINQATDISARWTQVDTIAEQNLVFNDLRSTRKKYEVDTREGDQITVVFGDGDFSEAPQGNFRFWMRQSANRSIVMQKGRIVNEPVAMVYTSAQGNTETCTLTFSLTSTLQNSAGTETIEHIRQTAPATYYAQNRMVNGQDYNTFLLKDSSIVRVRTVNRTFAGQPKHIDWNDASGKYENVKLFGEDATLRYDIGIDTQTTQVSGQAVIDSVIEPMLNTPGIINTILHVTASTPELRGVVTPPRRQFIDDNRAGIHFDKNGVAVTTGAAGSLMEKTSIQGLIDRHWYGEPIEYVQASDGSILARIKNPDEFPKDNSRIYAPNVPRTIDGVNKFPPGDIGSGLQPVAEQDYFGLRFNPYMRGVGNGTCTVLSRPFGSLEGEVWTLEVLADGQSLAVRSSLRGSFPPATIGNTYSIRPSGATTSSPFFTIAQGVTAFEPGDAFILDTPSAGLPTRRPFVGFPARVINLNGWWEVLNFSQLPDFASGIQESEQHSLKFTTADSPAELKQHSWVILIRKIRQQPSQTIVGYEVNTRDVKLVVESSTTRFWYNAAEQLLDSETQKRVFDNIRILRSNLDSNNAPLLKSQIYDVVGPVRAEDGTIDFNKLEIVPTDLLQEDDSGNLVPDRLLQFETFAAGSYEYFLLATPETLLDAAIVTEVPNPDGTVSVTYNGETFVFAPASFVAIGPNEELKYGRRQRMPQLGVTDPGLDFMWQHFSPYTNLIDPSVTNIHDAFIMTRGYYDNVISYVRGTSTIAPSAPTPLELRNSFGYLLNSKMLSDTVVLHPGRIKLLFGGLAEPQLRAKFKIVKAATANLTNERIKEEVLNVVNTFFDIDNWDFGDTFFATKLMSLIHQRLPVDIASVVLVPVFSDNSFGSLFTIEAGYDEILQTAAELADIEIVEALTSTVIRQSR